MRVSWEKIWNTYTYLGAGGAPDYNKLGRPPPRCQGRKGWGWVGLQAQKGREGQNPSREFLLLILLPTEENHSSGESQGCPNTPQSTRITFLGKDLGIKTDYCLLSAGHMAFIQ